MTAQIDIIAPASISLLGSLVETPDPAVLSVLDAAGGTVTVTITAGNGSARLSASGAAGAVVSANANTLTLSGTVAQLNAALASLAVSDAASDILTISASSAGVAAASTDIAVSEVPAAGPAFAAPPGTFAMLPYSVTSIGGLVLADPAAAGLAAAGLGRTETMAVTLSAASGVLFLPGLTAFSGISAAGVGTNQVILGFTADQLGAVNALLAGLEWAGPAAVSGLAYAARDVAGPLGPTVTSGNVVLDITGSQGPTVSLVTGADAAILGMTTLTAGSVLNVTGAEADIGGIFGAGSVFIAPGGALEVPYNLLALGGTSYDFGTLNAATLALNGTLIAPGGADVSGRLSIGAGGEIDFDGALIAGGGDTAAGLLDITLGAGALLTGSGDLAVGNFSESGMIGGTGTILAAPGESLVIAAGAISGVTLAVAGGGVLALGAIDPLYGVFNVTPVTVGASVVLDFAAGGDGAGAAGGLADTLAEEGGVIVITDAAGFAGRVVNFAPGDRLIFPGLTGLTVGNITASGFLVSGTNGSNVTQSYTISAAIPAGMTPAVGIDVAGDAEVSLRDAQADAFFGGVTVSQAALLAQPGTKQPLAGLDVLARSWNGQSVNVTLAVSHGSLSGPGVTSGAQVTLSAASPTALNAALQGLSYTGNLGASYDILTISSGSGALNGLLNYMAVGLSTGGGTVTGGFGDAAQVALFNDSSAAPVQGVAAPGALVVTGAKIFDASLEIAGLSGTALQVAGGAVAIFDQGTALALGADVTVAAGGLLVDVSEAFSVAGNVTVAGSVMIEGALAATGSLAVGGSLVSAGSLSAAAATVAAGGLALVSGGSANFGALVVSGMLAGQGAAVIEAGSATFAGVLSLGGTADFYAGGAVSAAGTVNIGPDAGLFAHALSQTGGVILMDGLVSLAGGLVADGSITLGGGTLLTPFVSLQPGAVLAGGGVVGAAGSLGVLLASGAGITASGNLLLADDVTLGNGAAMTVAASSALDVAHIVTGGSIGFAGAGAELTINDVGQFSAAVTGMVDHDAVDLVGVAPSLVSFAGGEVSIAGVGQFALGVAAGQPGLSLGSDQAGGTLITLGGDMPCFARGTRLLTPSGYRPVETLKPGDPLINLGGERRGVRWIGWRTLDLKYHDKAGPVTFAAHALGAGLPMRAVTLSPLHAVFIGGVLVPACHLVNGATITAAPEAAVTYYHVELDRHEVLLADGMAVESYLDNGNRGQLYCEIGQRGRAVQACAELVTGGPELAAIRRRLHAIALQAGFRLAYEPGVRAVAGTASVLPRRVKRQMRFAFPAAAALGLVARAAAPAETDPDSEDRRHLAVCFAGFPQDVRPGRGWYKQAEGDAGIWMGAGAELDFAGARTDLTLDVAGVIRSWVAPAPTIMLTGR